MKKTEPTPDPAPAPSAPDRLVYKPEVLALTGLHYPRIWQLMREGTFPRGKKLGTAVNARIAWKLSQILAWIDALPEQQLLGDPDAAPSQYVEMGKKGGKERARQRKLSKPRRRLRL